MLVDIDHIGSAPRDHLHETDPRKMTECFAHGRMAHPEARGDFALAQPRSRLDAPFDDVVSQETRNDARSEEHTSELQSLMRISYAVFCLKKKKTNTINLSQQTHTYP